MAQISTGDFEVDSLASLATSDPSTGYLDRSTNNATSCFPPIYRTRRTRYDSKFSGINKSAGTSQKALPHALLNQLEGALYGDESTSVDFKFKASVLFDELKKLMENESTNQHVNTAARGDRQEISRLAHAQSPKRKPKHHTKRVQQDEEMFPCTSPDCLYSTNSAMDWRRHEETHWPQKRYMCTKCPPSIDTQFPKCSFCMVPLPSALEIASHYLQCDSARRNGRTFARKDKLSEHLQKEHSMPQSSAMSQASVSTFRVDSGWLKRCNFCDVLFESWDDRTQHLIEDHFKRGEDHKSWHRSQQGLSNCPWPQSSVSLTANFEDEFTREPVADSSIDHQPLSKSVQQQFYNFSYSRPKIVHEDPTPEGFEVISEPQHGIIEPSSAKEELRVDKVFVAHRALADSKNPYVLSQTSIPPPEALKVLQEQSTHSSTLSSDLPTMFNMTPPLTPEELARADAQRELQEQIMMRNARNPQNRTFTRARRCSRRPIPNPLWKEVVHGVLQAVLDGKQLLLKERPKSMDESLSSAMASISIREQTSEVAIERTNIPWLDKVVKKKFRATTVPFARLDSTSVVKEKPSEETSGADDNSALRLLKLKRNNEV